MLLFLIFSSKLLAKGYQYNWLELSKITKDNEFIYDVTSFNNPIPIETAISSIFFKKTDLPDILLNIEIKLDCTIGEIIDIENSDSTLTNIIKDNIKKWMFIPASDNNGNYMTSWNIFNLGEYLKVYFFDVDSENSKDFSIYDIPPKAIKTTAPNYPEEFKRKSIEGQVLLNVVVCSDGSVGDILIVKSLIPELDKKCVEAVKQWKFEPAKYLGKPVTVWISFPIEFSLD